MRSRVKNGGASYGCKHCCVIVPEDLIMDRVIDYTHEDITDCRNYPAYVVEWSPEGMAASEWMP